MEEEKLDLHGYTVEQAKQIILDTIDLANEQTSKIVVVHGYNNGTKIRDMVRKNLKHKKISKIYLDFNPGITIIELNKKNNIIKKEKGKK